MKNLSSQFELNEKEHAIETQLNDGNTFNTFQVWIMPHQGGN